MKNKLKHAQLEVWTSIIQKMLRLFYHKFIIISSPNGYKTLFLDNTFSNEEEDVYKAGSHFEEIYAFMKWIVH